MFLKNLLNTPDEFWNHIEPDLTAKVVFTPKVRAFTVSVLTIWVAAHFLTSNIAALCTVVIMNCLYCFANTYKLLLFFNGLRVASATSDDELNVYIDDSKLPSYTILVPLFKEASVIGSLVKSINNIDYPSHKKQVLLILEEDDIRTINTANNLKLPSNFDVIVVPHSYPKTKAKACNYAMKFATGEITTIYDAEDMPDVDQLKKVAAKFSVVGKDVACIQAKLCYYNSDENWLANMFSLEYAHLFNYILPGICNQNLPIPLGGSSNHFRTKVLKELKGWDPYNVTEDADLGLRIAAKGYRVGMVNSFTHEEAPLTLKAWIKQRSRWIKGYFHTFFVYMRHPVYLYKRYEFNGFLFFLYMLFISPFILISMPMMIYFSANLMFKNYLFPDFIDQSIRFFTIFNLVYGSAGTVLIAYFLKHLKDVKESRLWWTFPFYFIFHTLASIWALYKLLTNPHQWDKTPHGLTKKRVYEV